MSTAPSLVLLIGLPGSGKSTLTQHLLQRSDQRRVIATDAIRQQLFGDEALQGAWYQVWREVQQQLQQAAWQLKQQQLTEVIYDATNTARRQRRLLIAIARDFGYSRITGLWLDVPLALCLQRNQQRSRQVPEAVILRMARQLSGAPPSLEEGLDQLIRLTHPQWT